MQSFVIQVRGIQKPMVTGGVLIVAGVVPSSRVDRIKEQIPWIPFCFVELGSTSSGQRCNSSTAAAL